jgi:alkanesulfonate monooxygenase SsuD/methylene tetrahydromethanopterin reductase-like flavin-dependent oxidoreductase (luciferase family)
MLHGERPTASGPRYSAKAVRNDPPPIQERMPLLVGGGGEQVTLMNGASRSTRNGHTPHC